MKNFFEEIERSKNLSRILGTLTDFSKDKKTKTSTFLQQIADYYRFFNRLRMLDVFEKYRLFVDNKNKEFYVEIDFFESESVSFNFNFISYDYFDHFEKGRELQDNIDITVCFWLGKQLKKKIYFEKIKGAGETKVSI